MRPCQNFQRAQQDGTIERLGSQLDHLFFKERKEVNVDDVDAQNGAISNLNAKKAQASDDLPPSYEEAIRMK